MAPRPPKIVETSPVELEPPKPIQEKPLPNIEDGNLMDSLWIDEPELVENPPFVPWAEVMPSFIGGEGALLNYLQKTLKYPTDARVNGIEGTIYVGFTVDKNGFIGNIKAKNHINGGLTQEAERVVKTMPRWIPGRQANIPVGIELTLPISFKLNR